MRLYFPKIVLQQNLLKQLQLFCVLERERWSWNVRIVSQTIFISHFPCDVLCICKSKMHATYRNEMHVHYNIWEDRVSQNHPDVFFEKKNIFSTFFRSFAHVCNRQNVGGKILYKMKQKWDFKMRFTRKCVTVFVFYEKMGSSRYKYSYSFYDDGLPAIYISILVWCFTHDKREFSEWWEFM